MQLFADLNFNGQVFFTNVHFNWSIKSQEPLRDITAFWNSDK